MRNWIDWRINLSMVDCMAFSECGQTGIFMGCQKAFLFLFWNREYFEVKPTPSQIQDCWIPINTVHVSVVLCLFGPH